jgi:hypothetical protein
MMRSRENSVVFIPGFRMTMLPNCIGQRRCLSAVQAQSVKLERWLRRRKQVICLLLNYFVAATFVPASSAGCFVFGAANY